MQSGIHLRWPAAWRFNFPHYHTMNSIPLLTIIAIVATAVHCIADEARTERIEFAAGESSAAVTGKVKGRDSVLYQLKAKVGQYLTVSLDTTNESADFNIYMSGQSPGDEALFASAMSNQGRKFTGQLNQSGDHSISVFLNRAARRREETANFTLHVSITEEPPVQAAEEKPATDPVPQKVVDDCFAALRKMVGDKSMTVISQKRGEASFIIDVKVEGAEKPWRCFHDGTQCTGTEYQGEG